MALIHENLRQVREMLEFKKIFSGTGSERRKKSSYHYLEDAGVTNEWPGIIKEFKVTLASLRS
jgi:hypothetical protein